MKQFNTRLYEYAIPQSDYVDVKVLAANVAETFTVPAGANYIVFSATADFYAKTGGTAVVPSGDISDGTGSALNPLYGRVSPGDMISVIMAGSGIITASYFS